MTRLRTRLHVNDLEPRATPAVLLHSLYPDALPPQTLASFGSSVSVSGNTVVVGASGDDTGALYAGSAYVYDLTSITPTVPIATLNNPSPAADDRFGWSVSVSGNTVVVGAFWDSTGATFAGSAYVYDLSSITPTAPIATLNNPSPAANESFGYSVSVSGNIVVVGAIHDDTGATDAGSAYVYDLSSMTPTVPIATLNNPSPAAQDYFGISVSVSGNTVVVGTEHDDTGAVDAGSAYVYDLSSMTPTVPVATLNNPNPNVEDFFGSVSVSGNTVFVGAPYDDTQDIDQGAAYVYTLAPAKVASVRINDGSAQRSRVTSVAVTFDQPVNFAGVPADAFQLRRQSDNAVVNLSATVNNMGPGTVVTLTFTGGAVQFGSLADGRYTLIIDASQVSNANGALDGDANGTPGGNFVFGDAQGLFRLFGDVNGDQNVNGLDFGFFKNAFGTQLGDANYLSYFDFNGDGVINGFDFGQFRTRFGTMLP